MNSTILLWLLPAVPVLIHLIRLQVKRKFVFSSTAFLEKFLQSQGWLTRILRILVLAMRVAFMAMLVYYLYTNFHVAESGHERVTVFIDNSASSLTRIEGKAILDVHKNRASDLALGLHPNSIVSVVTTSSATRNLSPEEAAVEIASIRPYFQRASLDKSSFSNSTRLVAYSDGGMETLQLVQKAAQGIENKTLVPEVAEGESYFSVDTAWVDDAGGRTMVHIAVQAVGVKRLAIKVNEVIVAYQIVKKGPNSLKVEMGGNREVANIEVFSPEEPSQVFYASILNKPVRYSSRGVTNRYVSAFLGYNPLFVKASGKTDFEVIEWNGNAAATNFSGSNVLVYPGKGVSVQAYTAYLKGFGIPAAVLSGSVPNEGFEMDPSASQPILGRILQNRENPQASYPFFRPLVEATSTEAPLAKTINGLPILVQKTINNSQVNFLTGPLANNTNLQNSSLFAPILYQLLVKKENSQLKYAWLDDDKQLMANNLFSDSLSPGFTLTGGKEGIPIGLNVAKQETLPSNPGALDELKKSGWNITEGDSIAAVSAPDQTIFPYLLLLGLILAAVEVVLLTRTFNANTPEKHPAGTRAFSQAN